MLVESRPRGRALDLACGLGRNALLLAELGFRVDAIDVSDVAVERVRGEAARRGLPVRATRADLSADAELPIGAYAVVLNVHFLERSLFPSIARALAPGGLLVFEAFTRDHAGMNPAYALEPGELGRAFASLETVAYRERDGRAGLVARRR